MATLLEKLQQNLGTVGGQVTPGDETGTVKQLLAAKKGIIGSPAALGPTGLATAEVAARAPAQQQLAQIGQAAQLQSAAIGQAAEGQAEEQRQREQAIAGQQQESSLRNRVQTENILRGLEQGRAEVGEKQRQQGLETVAANLRLQDARYVDNLRREGERARLQEDISFAEQLQKTVAEDNMAALKLQIKNKSLLNASDRDFDKAMAKLGYTDVINMAKENLKADSERALIGGTTGLVTTGIGAYDKISKGGLSSGYQSYLENLPEGTRPMSFTKWEAETEIDRMSSGGKTLPATGPISSSRGIA